jgi:Zn-dependent protease
MLVGLAMRNLRVMYGAVVFLSAFLLFLVEPMAAKQLLPVLGGSSAVWVTCLVFFQAALLLGYGYAWWMARQGKIWVHAALLGGGGACVAVDSGIARDGYSIELVCLGPSCCDDLSDIGGNYWAAVSGARIDQPAAAGVVGHE